MFCSQCGNDLRENDRFCSRCGADVHIDINQGETIERVQKSGGGPPGAISAQFSDRLLNNQCPFCGSALNSASDACPGCSAKITRNAEQSTKATQLGKFGIKLQVSRSSGGISGTFASDMPELVKQLIKQGQPTARVSKQNSAGHGAGLSKPQQAYSQTHQPNIIKESRPLPSKILLSILLAAAACILFYILGR